MLPKPGKIKRLYENNVCVGSAAYVSDTLLVTARHCVVDDWGCFLPVHLGKGKMLDFVAANPYDDLALVKVTGDFPYLLRTPVYK